MLVHPIPGLRISGGSEQSGILGLRIFRERSSFQYARTQIVSNGGA